MERSVKRANCRVSLILRTDKKRKNNKCPIYYLVRINDIRRKIPTHKEVEKKYWIGMKGKKYIKDTHPNAIAFNRVLQGLMNDVEEYILKMELKKEVITHTKIRSFLLGEDKHRLDFISYYENFVNEQKLYLKPNTIRDYKSSLEVLKEFLKKYKYNDLRLEDIDLNFVEKYDKYLRFERNNKVNSLYNRHKNLRAVLNRAIKERLIDEHPYQKDFTFNKEKGSGKAITINERWHIYKLPIENEKLDIARDIFVFCCYTGLRFSDALSLKWSNIYVFKKEKNNVSLYIKKIQEKVNKVVYIPILLTPNEILIKYCSKLSKKQKENKDVFNSLYIFPRISNQVMNRKLKEIAKIANIDKNLTTHIARRTFATNAKFKGVPYNIIEQLLGHGKKTVTKGYIDDEGYEPKELIPEIIKISKRNMKIYKKTEKTKTNNLNEQIKSISLLLKKNRIN